jgi:hypothetical protein
VAGAQDVVEVTSETAGRRAGMAGRDASGVFAA